MINFIAVLVNLGQAEKTAKGYKTRLAQSELGYDKKSASETFMFEAEEVQKMLEKMASAKSGKYKAGAEGMLLNPDNTYLTFTEEYVPTKTVSAKDKKIAELEAKVAELEAIIKDMEDGRIHSL